MQQFHLLFLIDNNNNNHDKVAPLTAIEREESSWEPLTTQRGSHLFLVPPQWSRSIDRSITWHCVCANTHVTTSTERFLTFPRRTTPGKSRVWESRAARNDSARLPYGIVKHFYDDRFVHTWRRCAAGNGRPCVNHQRERIRERTRATPWDSLTRTIAKVREAGAVHVLRYRLRWTRQKTKKKKKMSGHSHSIETARQSDGAICLCTGAP